MRTYILLLIVLLGFSCVEEKSEHIQIVTAEEMAILLKQDQVQLVDVRTVKEFKAGAIPKSQNIDFLSQSFEADILKLDKTRPVLVYCKKGGRSAKCAKKMEALGFTKIYDLDGGYSKWLSTKKE